jgi:hypothetical protein
MPIPDADLVQTGAGTTANFLQDALKAGSTASQRPMIPPSAVPSLPSRLDMNCLQQCASGADLTYGQCKNKCTY